jgi:hypothetical protein
MTTAPTLRARYAAQLERVRADPTSSTTTRLGEERGWLLRARVPDVVRPFLTSLPDGDADLARYVGLDASAAATLLERLTPGQLDDRQNDAPTLGAMLRAAVAHPDEVELHGYLVGPARDDERITAEGVDVYGLPELDVSLGHHDGCECATLWDLVQRAVGIDDAVCPPDEMVLLTRRWRPNETCWHLWWD